MSTLLSVDDASIARAVRLILEGKLVAFPTETVYGLGADATNGKAVAAIFAAKGRPSFNPLIIHVADTSNLNALIEWNDTAKFLAASLWPGPLTLILPRKKQAPISLLASAGLPTLAVRIPSHPTAQKFLRAVGVPVAAPSANASGKLSSTTPLHVAASLGDKVDLILADGRSPIGVESTVIDVTTHEPTLVRPGGVTLEQLDRILGRPVKRYEASQGEVVMSPGMLASHYAPELPLRLNADKALEGEAYLSFGPTIVKSRASFELSLSADGDLNEAASNLFSMLREADKPSYVRIAVAPIPETGIGAAINDRLRRAAVRM